ncbi:outer membrane beta-barrel protein [uncultured Tenacibaculum sp.]|uniref:outer membrane beta-barrel protein n=1 Tax=uncultured Tenacibaculum sp. TaxID=174713 RepID=UPI00263664F4|nr:outer membrane beta-barrel protein [uncultured Tenacibaculum sp.]
MKKTLLIIALILSCSMYAQSYKFKISGTIKSEKEKTAIEAATIHLEKEKDSTVLSYTISDNKGNFSLEGKVYNKNVKLFISFIGMDEYKKAIVLDKESNINLGTILLKEESNLLNEVVVKSRAPITIKKDTLEFNVKSFKTKKDANVEDLLKKLPGVEVNEEGQITVNGKPVNKILVNGKPFFGNDPTIATKNLSKEIIEKVQITDTKSKSEAFSGEKGDANNKTINLTIKEENNKGWFGRVAAGGGTDERYEAATIVNRFDNNTRFSVLAGTNNINSPGFSFGEITKMFGNSNNVSFFGNGQFSVGGRNFGGGQGIITSRTGGATYADEYGKGVDLNANYFYSGSDSENINRSNREYTVQVQDENDPTQTRELRYFTNSNSSSTTENDNHNFDADLDIEIDSTFLINVTPRFTFNDRSSNFTQSDETLDENRALTNRFSSNSFSTSEAKNFQNRIDITKKFGNKGGFIKASITNQIDQTEGEDFNNSTIETFGTNANTEIRDQKTDITSDLNGFRTRLSYRQPIIAKKLFINLNYRYRIDERTRVESTFDFDNATQDFTNFNTDLSTNFTFNDITKTPLVGITYDTKSFNLDFDIGQTIRTLENQDVLRPNLSLNKDFNNVTVDASMRYRFPSKARVYIGYNLDNNAPGITQLQPFTDVSNPSNIVTGNPNLRPSQNHRVFANFNKYNWQKRTGFFFWGGGDITNNQIVSKTTIGDDLVRTTTYENADGVYSFYGGGSYNRGIKLDSVSTFNIRTGLRFNASKSLNILNEIENTTKTNAITPRLGFEFNWKKKIVIEPNYEIAFTNTRFNANNIADQNFTRHSLRIRTRTSVPKKLEWRNDVRYTFNPNVIGFNRSAWFWNSTLSYSILKDKGTITLKAYDVLNQNTNARRTVVGNYVEDSESTVLQQYFMLGFSWKFNSLGKKGEVRDYGFH